MPAQITSSTPKSLYEYVGKNLAPKLALTQLGQNKPTLNPNELGKALETKYLHYKKYQYEAFIEYCDQGRMVANLRTGKLLLMRHALNNRYMFVKKDGKFSDNKTVGGRFQFYSTKLTAEWLSSRPERDPVCPSDDDQIEEFISAVKIVQQFYDQKFFDTNYETLESLAAQDYGTWITRYRFDPDTKEIICELLDFPACRWDYRFRAEDSDHFIYESKCSNAVLEKLLDAEIAEDGQDSDNYGLQMREQIALAGGSAFGAGKERPYGTTGSTTGENTVIEMWLQPSAYCDIDLPISETTVAGITIPKGQSLMDIFPTGMCVVGINNMRTIIGLYAENHKDHIVTGLYHVQSFSGVGKGISDAVDVMKELNDLHSQLLVHTKAHAMPGFGYNSDMISEEQARNIGKPRKMIPMAFSQAPDGVHSINQVVEAILPGQPANSAFEYMSSLNNDLQMSMQVTDFSNGLPGVDNKTATGAKIGDANAEMILVPQHLNKADHRKRSDVVIFNLFKRFVDKPKFFASKNLNGITKGKYLSGSQFNDVDIDFEIVANSEVPNTPLQDSMNLDHLLQQSGGVAGYLQAVEMNPEITGEITSTYGVKLSVPKKTDIARVCRKRIEQAKQILTKELQLQKMMQAVSGQPVDNSNLAASIVSQVLPPISPKEPFATQKITWLAELLDDDEMQYAPQELRYIIEEMIDRHLLEATLGQAQVQQDQNIGMVMSELPMLLGEQAMSQSNQQMEQQFEAQQQQQQAQQQQADAQGQAQQQLQAEGQKAQIQNQQSEADHQRAMAQNAQTHAQATEQANQQHEHSMRLESLKAMAAIHQAKQQAKLKPKAKAA